MILDLAEKGPCVIVGRCADYILDTASIPALNVFIHANMEYRKAPVPTIATIPTANGVSPTTITSALTPAIWAS